jgi:hypothetical protein
LFAFSVGDVVYILIYPAAVSRGLFRLLRFCLLSNLKKQGNWPCGSLFVWRLPGYGSIAFGG